MIQALRNRVKYAFVMFNGNNSFDHEFGAFPGANGIYSDGEAPAPRASRPPRPTELHVIRSWST